MLAIVGKPALQSSFFEIWINSPKKDCLVARCSCACKPIPSRWPEAAQRSDTTSTSLYTRVGWRWSNLVSNLELSLQNKAYAAPRNPRAVWNGQASSANSQSQNAAVDGDSGASASDPRNPKRRRIFSSAPFLVLSAIAASAFLRRQRGSYYKPEFGALAAMGDSSTAVPQRRIDSHLHVWASSEEAKTFPYFPGQEPPPELPGSADFLLESMVRAGVWGALIVQPINHKFDHSYVTSVVERYPGRFVGCCLADPTDGGGGVQELERLVTQEGYRAVRFNPYLWPAGQKMTNEVGRAMFTRAGELGIPVGFMCFKGLMLHIDEIEELCSEYPDTKVMMDHFGFCKPATTKEEEEAWERLLGLARFPQVYVKTSAFFRVSREDFPYRDTWTLVRQLVDVFGAEKIIWGSDFPFVTEQCGYTNAWQVLPELEIEDQVLSPEEKALVMGGSAMALFPGAWEDAA